MKKLIIICLLALSYTSTYAQEPTKQETMDWIASKFRDNISDEILYKFDGDWTRVKYRFESYSSGILILSYVLKSKGEISSNSKIKINFNGLTNFSSTDYYLSLNFREGNVENGYSDSNTLFVWKAVDAGSVDSIINWGSEPELYNRFIKALNVLINYNNPKQKF